MSELLRVVINSVDGDRILNVRGYSERTRLVEHVGVQILNGQAAEARVCQVERQGVKRVLVATMRKIRSYG